MTDEPSFELLPMPATLSVAFDRTVARRRERIAVRSHDRRVAWTWGELDERVSVLARAFHGLGVRRGDVAALLTRNRPEFYPLDLALVRLGVVTVSLYLTSAPEQQQHVLRDSGARLLVAEPALMQTLDGVELPELAVQLEGEPADGWTSWSSLLARADGIDVAGVPYPSADDLLTLIYTSGTTGSPKGVMMTHRTMLTTVDATLEAQRIPEGSTAISWLPYAHVGGRLGGYMTAVVQGWELVTVADPREVVDALAQIRPGAFSAPPRTFEKLRAGFDTWMLGLDDVRRESVRAALADCERRVDLEQAGQAVPAALREATDAARRDLFAPWRRSVGLDRLRVAVVATAPNPGPLMRFYHAVGIPMGEAYGLSESAASGTAARPEAIRIGTVGTVSRHMELRIADDGEILLRGPAVTPGYLNNPKATAEAIDADGWLHTGDLGLVDDDGYLKVVGRKKEIIINSSGKNIAPVTVESAVISASPLIGQVCCIGDARPYAVALVVLDREYAAAWVQEQLVGAGADVNGGAEARDVGELARHPLVVAEVERAVAAANTRLNRPEQVKKFHIVANEWVPGRELTPTSKMRRSEISRLYEGVIEELYA